ncbi:ImcF-related family protein [Pseudomonas sp. HR96]|uniref:ImcF-related family protein n=1 Tax=Pseudomonas sp. HR96 TaxID=1027966 RepID=UPI002A750FBA|nr:ImcF-related family protein [Pseudomonas sp. HR96]WPO98705.1 ImcF-related family protein [Pseudomonas sp. HR96]
MHNKRISSWIIVLCLLLGGGLLIWVDNPLVPAHGETDSFKWTAALLALGLATHLLGGLGSWIGRTLGAHAFYSTWRDKVGSRGRCEALPVEPALGDSDRMATYLRDQFGLLWRRKARLLLVVGVPEHVEAVAPTLCSRRWLDANGCLLIWGGSQAQMLDSEVIVTLQKLRPHRPVDAIVWALATAQRDDYAHMASGARHLRQLTHTLRWQPPLYLWQVCASHWPQTGRPGLPAGCLWSRRASLDAIEKSLRSLITPLREQGVQQMHKAARHDFFLRLSVGLAQSGIADWRQALSPLLNGFARGTPLRGLFFSLPLEAVPTPGLPHLLQTDDAWLGILRDRRVRGRALGWHPARVAYLGAMAGMGVALLGMLLAYAGHRAQLAEIPLAALQPGGEPPAQVFALHELARELDRLEYQREHGAPWQLGLATDWGLNANAALGERLWPLYAEGNNRLIRDVARQRLEARLRALVALPASSPQRAEAAQQAYDPLKAYLMMAQPDKVDAGFLAATLAAVDAQRADVPSGLWQTLAPRLWQFYAEQLAAHPQWAIAPDRQLIAQARQVMLGQLGQRNGEAALYHEVLEQARRHYPDLTLAQMVADTDVAALFGSDRQVPGVFTRQAWEGQVRKAIERIAEGRREQIDWVLSDQPGSVAGALSPQALKAQLTERYFADFSGAWLGFLNSLRWRKAADLPQVIDQLSLMSDVRQSPLIALVNTLAYQGQTGAQGQALADSLIQSAQRLVDVRQAPAIDQHGVGLRGPLDATFGPLLQLLDKGAEANSLQDFLTRVTRVRLKLQQISNAADPQAMTQALAQSVFQGRSVDLSDTRDYGSLLAAGLGAQWSGFGQSLFVEPLSQAWQSVLQPSAASLNRQWQRNIVAHWEGAFGGRYPFAATLSDASLPMLGQMIRRGSGHIDQFLASQLGGVLHREGKHWVADRGNSQGLRFNPQFLKALDQLSELAEVLYTDGNLGLHFDLRAKPVRDVVQTTLRLDGQTLEYFNQMESWQRFAWPGRNDYPGVQLSWTSLTRDSQVFGEYEGSWGLIRWLELAKVTPLDDSDTRFRLVLKAPDGLPLTWHLRTDLGHGPLALLKLRGFKLPEQIFQTSAVSGEYLSMEES